MHPNSILLFEAYARRRFMAGARVLEIGPDATPSTFQALVSEPGIVWETIDLAGPANATVPTYLTDDPYRFSMIPDDAYDIVLSGQVIEHVPRIWAWMKELARVCRPGGNVVTICPVSWPYHEAPKDCWRIYPAGFEALYSEAGLEMEIGVWDSLEFPGYARRVAGASGKFGIRGRAVRWAQRAMGLSVTCAFDTIAIGRKPQKPDG